MTPSLSSKLETTFETVLVQRMQGLPFINSCLSVKAIGFRQWNDQQLGILITPWFMNLILAPDPSSTATNCNATTATKVGSMQKHIFPSGTYAFVTGYEESFGYYQSCSLFSPMFEFDDQSVAELTAISSLEAIMNEQNCDTESQNPTEEIEQIWNGEIPQPVNTIEFDGTIKPANAETTNEHPKEELHSGLSERLQQPSSRRDFLSGNALKNNMQSKKPNSEHNA